MLSVISVCLYPSIYWSIYLYIIFATLLCFRFCKNVFLFRGRFILRSNVSIYYTKPNNRKNITQNLVFTEVTNLKCKNYSNFHIFLSLLSADVNLVLGKNPPGKKPPDSKRNPIHNLTLSLPLTPHGELFFRGDLTL